MTFRAVCVFVAAFIATPLPGCGKSAAPTDSGVLAKVAASPEAGVDGGMLFPGCVHVPVVPKCHDGFCLITAGCFVMGSPPNEPYRSPYFEDQRPVTLTHSFLIAQRELTQAEWVAAGYPNLAGTMNDGAGGTDCVASDCPASTMSWYEAVTFLNQKSQAEGRQSCISLDGCTGKVGMDFNCTGYHATTTSYYECTGYRLFTGAEFQYAARAGTSTAFYSGPFDPSSGNCVDVTNLDSAAWYCSNAGKRTHPVGQKVANAWGLYDILGNAAEYTGSVRDTAPAESMPQTDPYAVLGTSGIFGTFGGFFFEEPAGLRSASQAGFFALSVPRSASMGTGLGFRLVRTTTPAEAAAW